MKVWLKRIAWGLFFCGMIVLMFMAQSAQKSLELSKPEIMIHVNGEHAFLTEDELYDRLKRNGFFRVGVKHEELNAEGIERFIRGMSEVKEVKVFTRIGQAWHIDVTLRIPIARIYNKYGTSFYLDSDGVVMQTSDLHSARVVVFTGNIPDKLSSVPVEKIINNKSLKRNRKLDDVYRISNYVCNDPFLHSLIGQFHLKKNGDFVLVPLVGGQKIIFGSANSDEEVKDKFDKLKIFYSEAVPFEGWNKYDEISLKYDDQIVGRKVDGYVEEEVKEESKTQ
jgi:cell division protein FtsQ